MWDVKKAQLAFAGKGKTFYLNYVGCKGDKNNQ